MEFLLEISFLLSLFFVDEDKLLFALFLLLESVEGFLIYSVLFLSLDK